MFIGGCDKPIHFPIRCDWWMLCEGLQVRVRLVPLKVYSRSSYSFKAVLAADMNYGGRGPGDWK